MKPMCGSLESRWGGCISDWYSARKALLDEPVKSVKPVNSSIARIATISRIPKHSPPPLAETGDNPCFGQPSSAETSRLSSGTEFNRL
eukprot:3148710-Rhodomonas_salina.1